MKCQDLITFRYILKYLKYLNSTTETIGLIWNELCSHQLSKVEIHLKQNILN